MIDWLREILVDSSMNVKVASGDQIYVTSLPGDHHQRFDEIFPFGSKRFIEGQGGAP